MILVELEFGEAGLMTRQWKEDLLHTYCNRSVAPFKNMVSKYFVLIGCNTWQMYVDIAAYNGLKIRITSSVPVLPQALDCKRTSFLLIHDYFSAVFAVENLFSEITHSPPPFPSKSNGPSLT